MEINSFVIFIAAIFTSNILLTNFLGMCSFLSVSKQIESSLGLGMAVFFVLTLTTVINYAVYHYLLIPLNLVYLQYIIFYYCNRGFLYSLRKW